MCFLVCVCAVNALNQMNQLNHMNQLAALQAQQQAQHQAQRMMDPRLQPLPTAPLSPRSSGPTSGIPGLMMPPSSSPAAINSALKHAFSPAAGKPGEWCQRVEN